MRNRISLRSSTRLRYFARAILILLLASAGLCQSPSSAAPSQPTSGMQAQPNAGPPAQDGGQIVQFLSQTVSWYRQLAVEQQLATEPSDLSYLQEDRQVADEVVRLAFQYARAELALRAKQHGKPVGTQSAPQQQYQALEQAAQQSQQQIQDTQAELDSTKAKLARAPASKRKTLEAQVAELESEVNLLQARREALQSMVEFVSTSNSGGGTVGLRAQIDALARSVPASLSQAQGTNTAPNTPEPAAVTNNAANRNPQPTGIWGLSAALLHLSGKMHTLDDEIALSGALSQKAKELRKPLLDYLRNLIQQGNQLFSAADTATPAQLDQQKQQLDLVTAQFKETSNVMLPLSKIIVLQDVYQRSLSNWRDTIKYESRDELRQLLLRVGVLVVLIVLVLGIGEIWRRTTFRYVHDVHRRYQFLLLRRVVIWVAIGLIIVLTFATQLGSAVTFAGLLTAGVAVALQNVIVSIVAYFFLIGKYGIRVGDRVQIAGVTGEVVDIGLVRIHVMELAGQSDAQPTGRIVAFSNSIVFQPNAGLFKQIPGTDFIWHELKLTLASDTDYHTAKERITQAVDAALASERENIEAQRRSMEKSLTTVAGSDLRPRIRLHYTASGIEATVRFPVLLGKASEMDDHLMKEVMEALDREPKLKLVGAEMPTVKAGA
jgi:small-conductance mechanosensitive channel